MKPCGHVTCKTCTDTLVRPASQCVVCDVQLSKDAIIELCREGELIFGDQSSVSEDGVQGLGMLEVDWQKRPRRESPSKDSECQPLHSLNAH
jgi:hypothetical protein